MPKKIRNHASRGTPNRYDGRFDYGFPSNSPWSTGSSSVEDAFYSNDQVADSALIPTLSDGTPYLPLITLSRGGTRSEDDDGFLYDILIWEIDTDAGFGFSQEVYVFKEGLPGQSTTQTTQAIPLIPGGTRNFAVIFIEDYSSPPVQAVTGETPEQFGNPISNGMYGSDGDDHLHGLEGNDGLYGGEGDDWLNGGTGADFLVGGAGQDHLYGEADQPDTPSDLPALTGDVLHGLEGDDNLYGGSGNDFLYGWSDDDRLYGGSGNDLLVGDDGTDQLYGGTGHDTYVATNDFTDSFIEQSGAGNDLVLSFHTYTLPNHIETLYLIGSNATFGWGNDLDNVIETFTSPFTADGERIGPTQNILDDSPYDYYLGSQGGDSDTLDHTIQGGGGNDIIYAYGGDDTLQGDAGNDTLVGDAGYDLLDGASGNDFLDGGNGDDFSLTGGDGDDTILGGAGNDWLTGGTGADSFAFRFYKYFYSNDLGGLDTINDFKWQEGDKIHIYAPGFDLATTDYYRFSYNSTTGALSFDGVQFATLQAGLDFVTYLDIIIADTPLSAAFPPYNPLASTQTETPAPATQLTGTVDADHLVGTEGNDDIAAGDGDDLLWGLEGGDRLQGEAGNDTLSGGSGADTLLGGEGRDHLFGEAGIDTVEGGAGHDTLKGGTGNDTLTGGTGADRFNFYNPAIDGTDTITDFNVAEDEIGIYVGAFIVGSAYKTAGLTVNTPLNPDQFQVGTAAVDSSDRFIYNSTSGALFFDADGTGTMQPIQIATLSPGLALSAANILAFDETNAIAPPDPMVDEPDLDSGMDDGPAIEDGSAIDDGSNDSIAESEILPILPTEGDDVLLGTPGQDSLVGLGGNDTLNSGAGNDALDGGSGNDTLVSGIGNDKLKGGKQRDLFVLEKGLGKDIILDFKDRQDRLGLSPGLKFKKLDIVQKGKNTLISVGNDPLVVLKGVKANQITAADFVSVPSSVLTPL